MNAKLTNIGADIQRCENLDIILRDQERHLKAQLNSVLANIGANTEKLVTLRAEKEEALR